MSFSGVMAPGWRLASTGLLFGVDRLPNFLLKRGLFLMLSTAPEAAFLTASIAAWSYKMKSEKGGGPKMHEGGAGTMVKGRRAERSEETLP